ncbi:hypothetical protein LCGC14_0701870 [marine sediment metagenome]|uniref:Uncharacterized protein n=1 Tax=marine sediment metagenome TaxID=412755 RepID=A0A0F9QHH4_9ZZZZ
MTDLNVGDRIRIKPTSSVHAAGTTGTVIRVRGSDIFWCADDEYTSSANWRQIADCDFIAKYGIGSKYIGRRVGAMLIEHFELLEGPASNKPVVLNKPVGGFTWL